MHDRVPLDDEGRISGRGPVERPGGIRGSVFSSKGDSASSRRWKRLSLIDRRGGKGPTRSKLQTIELIRKLAATTTHLQIALDLLELGWPDSGSGGSSIASENPMWRPAHPRGVPSSAAVCLHLAAYELGFDSKFEEWVSKCMPGKRKAASYGYRCLKRMRVILGEYRLRRESMDREARAILSRANLGDTVYSGISRMIWEEWLAISETDSNISNHPRPILALICENLAIREGIGVDVSLICDRFNLTSASSYRTWKVSISKPV